MRVRAALAAVLLGALASIPASADDHAPPTLVLHAGGRQQTGRAVTTTWTNPSSNGGCIWSHGDGIWAFPDDPPLMSYLGRSRAEIVVHEDTEPKTFELWASVDTLVAPSAPVTVELERRASTDGSTDVWVASFEPLFPGTNYLSAYVVWPAVCGDREGVWNFSLVAAVDVRLDR